MNRVKRGIVWERVQRARALVLPERKPWERRSGTPMSGSVAAQRAAGLKRVRRQQRNLMNEGRVIRLRAEAGWRRVEMRRSGRYVPSGPWKRAR